MSTLSTVIVKAVFKDDDFFSLFYIITCFLQVNIKIQFVLIDTYFSTTIILIKI